MSRPPLAALAPQSAAVAWPLFAAAVSALCFVGMDAVIKSMSNRFDALELTFFRFASGSVFAVILWAWQRTALPQGREWRSHLLRSALLLVSLTSYFHALRLLPLAQVVALSYTAPLFLSVLAVGVLHERPSRWVWLAMCTGVVGVAISAAPALRGAGDGAAIEGVVSVTVGALAFAGVMVLARVQAQRDSLWTILLLQNLLPMAALALPFAWLGDAPATSDLPAIGLAGALATAGVLCLTWAFSHLEASRVAPLEFTSIVWAAGFGYAFFGEVPSATTLASAALIIGACGLLLRR